jgi:hypothetical protein
MFRRNELTGWALIKHTTWIGTKWLFLSLVAIIALVWLSIIVILIYRSQHLDISVFELLRILDNDPNNSRTNYFGSSLITFALLSLELLGVSTLFGAVIFAIIGCVAAVFTKRTPIPNQTDQFETPT